MKRMRKPNDMDEEEAERSKLQRGESGAVARGVSEQQEDSEDEDTPRPPPQPYVESPDRDENHDRVCAYCQRYYVRDTNMHFGPWMDPELQRAGCSKKWCSLCYACWAWMARNFVVGNPNGDKNNVVRNGECLYCGTPIADWYRRVWSDHLARYGDAYPGTYEWIEEHWLEFLRRNDDEIPFDGVWVDVWASSDDEEEYPMELYFVSRD